MEQTKEPTRDYTGYSDTPWGLWDTLYARRSHRKYLPGDIDDAFKGRLEEVSRLAFSARGAEEGSLLVVTGKDRVERIRRRLHKGVQGKINLWMNKAPVTGFLVLALPRDDVRSDRPQGLPVTVMAAEDMVLWLTEAGMGTCWLGGISQVEVREVLGLGNDTFIPAVIPFGKPKPHVGGMDVDHVMYRQISRKRKPLSAIACIETVDRPYPLPQLEREPFSASDIQDVAGLLRRLEEKRESSGSAPIGLAMDACFEAARISPSAGNSQKWHFIAVTHEDSCRELARACGMEGTWRFAVVGAGDTEMGFLYERMEKPFWMMDLPIAFSQMSLMAASMDLAVDLGVRGIDEKAVNAVAGLKLPLRSVGVMGIR